MGDVFKRAIKSQAKLRAAFFGPSGSGKTFSALAIASGMGTRIALIDSERGSASKYADKFNFDVVDLEVKNIDAYVSMISAAAEAGYEVLIIDSLSHAWQELLEEIDKLANAKYRGNTWSAWSEGTPKQRQLIDAILSFPGHVIVTMRSKTEWQTSTDDKGKSRPIRVGLAPEQGKGIEYEFDLLLELSTEHIANVIKDRTGKFQDKLYEKPGAAFGQELIAWLNSGEASKPKTSPEVQEINTLKAELGDTLKAKIGEVPVFSDHEIDDFRGMLQALDIPNTKAGALPGLRSIVKNAKETLATRKAQEEERIRATFRKDRQEEHKGNKEGSTGISGSVTLSPAAQAVADAAGVTMNFQDDIPASKQHEEKLPAAAV